MTKKRIFLVTVFSLALILISCEQESQLVGAGSTGPSNSGDPVVDWIYSFTDGTISKAYCVDNAVDGGFILSGSSDDELKTYLVKTSSDGAEEWSKSFDLFAGKEYGYAVKSCVDGSFTVAGYGELRDDSLLTQAFLFHIDAEGDSAWLSSFAGNIGDQALSLEFTNDWGYILAGKVNYHYGLIRTNASGEQIWAQHYGVASGSNVRAIRAHTTPNGFITIGIDYSITNILLRKFDYNGEFEWDQLIDAQQPLTATDLKVCSDNGYCLTGYTSPLNSSNQDIFFLRTDELGENELLTYYTFEGFSSKGKSIQQVSGGAYVIAGDVAATDSLSEWNDITLFKIDTAGDLDWSIIAGLYENNYANSLVVTDDLSFVVAGYTESDSTNNSEALLLKIIQVESE
ncbi:MAG: hypothetical protein P9L92_01715 [Candidatus Electryonea clarkiae]|nr:hypothetical protein [Candidatus Electryonea clarkiae]MDP8285372.1 hypothetical protein [Candidatus Electryonea clarkiae]